MTSMPPEEIGRTVGKLASSRLVIAVVLWAATGLGGWHAAKLDTSKDLTAIREDIQKLTNQQRALVERIDGELPAIKGQVIGIQRDALYATIAALAYETEKNQDGKRAEAKARAADFTTMLGRGEAPAASALSIVEHAALPKAVR